MASNDVSQSWDRFLWQKEFVKNYRAPFQLYSQGEGPPTLITDQILPGLMYIRLVSILDEALSNYIITNNLQIPPKFRSDLKGKIDFLDSMGILKDSTNLHKIRDKRNKLAHNDSERIAWNEVEPAINIVHNELQNMKFLGDKPQYKFFAERSELKKSNEPGIIGSFLYTIGVKLNGNTKAAQSWSVRISDDKT